MWFRNSRTCLIWITYLLLGLDSKPAFWAIRLKKTHISANQSPKISNTAPKPKLPSVSVCRLLVVGLWQIFPIILLTNRTVQPKPIAIARRWADWTVQWKEPGGLVVASDDISNLMDIGEGGFLSRSHTSATTHRTGSLFHSKFLHLLCTGSEFSKLSRLRSSSSERRPAGHYWPAYQPTNRSSSRPHQLQSYYINLIKWPTAGHSVTDFSREQIFVLVLWNWCRSMCEFVFDRRSGGREVCLGPPKMG